MSIMNRLNRIIRSNINDLRQDSRSGSIDHVLGEMESSLKDARKQAALIRREEKKLIAQIRGHRDKADEWEDRAMMALKQGEEDLARDALRMRNEAMDQVAQLRDELDDHRAQARDIDSAIEALELKLDGTRARVGTFSSGGSKRRQRSARPSSSESAWDAEFRRRVGDQRGAESPASRAAKSPPVADDLEGSAGARLFSEVDRMGSKIDAFEAEIDAARELSDEDFFDPGRRELDERFRELERRRRAEDDDDDLAALKRKFEE